MLELPIDFQAALTQLSHAKLSMQITNTYNEPGISNLVSVIQQILIIVTQQQETIATLKTQVNGLDITKQVMSLRKRHDRHPNSTGNSKKPKDDQKDICTPSSTKGPKGDNPNHDIIIDSTKINQLVEKRLIGVEEHVKWISTVQVRQSKILEKLNNWSLGHTLDMVKMIIQDGTGQQEGTESLTARIDRMRVSTRPEPEYVKEYMYERVPPSMERLKQAQVLNSKSQSSIAMPALRSALTRNKERPRTTFADGVREENYLRVSPSFSTCRNSKQVKQQKTLISSQSSKFSPATVMTTNTAQSQSQREISTKGGGFHLVSMNNNGSNGVNGEESNLQKEENLNSNSNRNHENHTNPINELKLNVIHFESSSSDQSGEESAKTEPNGTSKSTQKHVVDRNSGMLQVRNSNISDRNLLNIRPLDSSGGGHSSLHSRVNNNGFQRRHLKGQTFEQMLNDVEERQRLKRRKKKMARDSDLIGDSLKILRKHQERLKMKTFSGGQQYVRPTWKARLPGHKSAAVDRLKMKNKKLSSRSNPKKGQVFKMEGVTDNLSGW